MDRNPDAPGQMYSDKFIAKDFTDKLEVFRQAESHRVDAIIPTNDYATRAAFFANQKLGLVGCHYLTGICGNNKYIMRRLWDHEDIPQPKYFLHESRYKSDIRDIELPLIVKPVDSGGGSRGVFKCDEYELVEQCINVARRFDKNDQVLIEGCMIGLECTVECLVHKGTTYTLLIGDKVFDSDIHTVSRSINYPSLLPQSVQHRIHNLVSRSNCALGIVNGVTHTEVIVSFDYENIWMIETGVRGGGGHIFSRIIYESTGVNAPVELAKILCGYQPNLDSTKQVFCTYRFLMPRQFGVYNRYILDDTMIPSGIIDYDITIAPGSSYDGIKNDLDRIGFVISRGNNQVEAVTAANEFESNIMYDFSSFD